MKKNIRPVVAVDRHMTSSGLFRIRCQILSVKLVYAVVMKTNWNLRIE